MIEFVYGSELGAYSNSRNAGRSEHSSGGEAGGEGEEDLLLRERERDKIEGRRILELVEFFGVVERIC
jgi:hypothetical protein